MFRKKNAEHSALRFCQTASELPYFRLTGFSHLTVAISRTETVHDFPAGRSYAESPRAYGLFHGSSVYLDGSAEPMVPVDISFHREVSHDCLGQAWLGEHYGTSEQFKVLQMSVRDPDGSIFAAVHRALTNAALSQERFCHVRFLRKDHKTESPGTKVAERLAAEKAFLERVDAGEADFPRLEFDGLFFESSLCAQSPSWAWSWPNFEEGGPRFFDKGTAKWRASHR